MIPTEACRCDARGDRGVWRYFKVGTEPTRYCSCHIMVDYDIINGGVACSKCPEENIAKVGMIQVQRDFPIQIYVSDAQYVWKEINGQIEPRININSPFFENSIKIGHYCGVSRGEKQYNRYCIYHYTNEDLNEEVEEEYIE